MIQLSSLIVPVNILFLHSSSESMYSDCDDICDATFIINSAVKLIVVVSSTWSDCDHACKATFVNSSASNILIIAFLHISSQSLYIEECTEIRLLLDNLQAKEQRISLSHGRNFVTERTVLGTYINVKRKGRNLQADMQTWSMENRSRNTFKSYKDD